MGVPQSGKTVPMCIGWGMLSRLGPPIERGVLNG